MQRRVIRIIVLVIVVIFAWFYLIPYVQLMFSPFSWKEADINKDGFVSPTEAAYFSDYGKKLFMEGGKGCREYYSLKDGLTLKKDCNREAPLDHQSITAYLSAGATLFVAILAIWGEWFRAKLAPPKLKIDIHNLRGDLTNFTNGNKAIFYHLKVVNERKWITIKNCRVQLVGIFRRGPDGQFRKAPLSVPVQFTWAPAEFSPLFETINNERIFDLGFISENDTTGFQPRVIPVPNNFQGFVKCGEACRYSLQIIADNYTSKIQVFEVSWDGVWTDRLDTMANSLVVTEVQAAIEAYKT